MSGWSQAIHANRVPVGSGRGAVRKSRPLQSTAGGSPAVTRSATRARSTAPARWTSRTASTHRPSAVARRSPWQTRAPSGGGGVNDRRPGAAHRQEPDRLVGLVDVGHRRGVGGRRHQGVGTAPVLVHPGAHADPRRRDVLGLAPRRGAHQHLPAPLLGPPFQPVEVPPVGGQGRSRSPLPRRRLDTQPGGQPSPKRCAVHRRTLPARAHRAGGTAYHAPVGFRAYLVTNEEGRPRGSVRSLGPDDLPPGEVLVRVDWSAVNYKDGLVLQPGNRVARTWPLVPGVDLAGTVAASDDPLVGVGTEVVVHGYELGVARHGGFAEYARVPAGWVVPLPPGLDARRAMILGTAGFTAVLSLRRLEQAGLEPGAGPVLVTGASGGVGSLAVALLARHGYEVVASTGKSGEHPYLTGLGAAEVIGREDIGTADGRVLGAQRWAGAIDCVGGATLGAVLRTLRYGAAVAASGLTGGSSLETTVFPFIVRAVSLIGIDSVATPLSDRRAVWASMADEFPPATAEALVAREVGLDTLTEALEAIGQGTVRGRVLVRPGT